MPKVECLAGETVFSEETVTTIAQETRYGQKPNGAAAFAKDVTTLLNTGVCPRYCLFSDGVRCQVREDPTGDTVHELMDQVLQERGKRIKRLRSSHPPTGSRYEQ